MRRLSSINRLHPQRPSARRAASRSAQEDAMFFNRIALVAALAALGAAVVWLNVYVNRLKESGRLEKLTWVDWQW
jgi:hypothetical protein